MQIKDISSLITFVLYTTDGGQYIRHSSHLSEMVVWLKPSPDGHDMIRTSPEERNVLETLFLDWREKTLGKMKEQGVIIKDSPEANSDKPNVH